MLRFAPSPTGDMPINSLRIAILNYLVSQQKNKQFLVRIEDINSQQNIKGKDSEIMMILEKFALKHNAVFHQSEHLNLYMTLALRLLTERKAFVCTCIDDFCVKNCKELTSEDYNFLKASSKNFVIRLTESSFVIIELKGMPSYNFACATDDMMSGINFVIRDEKYLKNTPNQIEIQKLLGYEDETSYVHIPSILNSEEIPTLQWLLEEGFLPDAILNYLLLLGNSKIPKEIFTLPQAIEWFKLDDISELSPTFDVNKLRHINAEHLNLMDNKKLSTLFGFADAEIGQLAKVYLEECSTIKELKDKIEQIFKAKDFTGQWAEEMKIMANVIANAPAFETLNELRKHIKTQSGLDSLKPLQCLLTGSQYGPELSKVYPLIKSYILEIAS